METQQVDWDCLSTSYVEAMLEEYLRDPSKVPEAWRETFARMAEELDSAGDSRRTRFRPSFGPSSLFNPTSAFTGPSQRAGGGVSGGGLSAGATTVSTTTDSSSAAIATTAVAAPRLGDSGAASGRSAAGASSSASGAAAGQYGQMDMARLQDRVAQLIRAYRVRGHLVARIDPLGKERPDQPELALDFHGLSEADLDRQVSTTSIGGPQTQTLREIVRRLRNTYCRNIACQFMHIDDLAVRDWLQHRMEESENHVPLTRDEQLRILTKLTDAVIFEEFVRRKHVGAKTFSLEGAESLIPLLDMAIEKSAAQGVGRVVLGMAHRGRLNVLANIMGKRPQEIFWEFKDAAPHLFRGGGDVKYHLGFASDYTTSSGDSIHLSLCFNPSHLEFVNTVAMGRLRAKQDRDGDVQRQRGLTILIHGDAAFAGEGIVQETLNLSQLPGYKVGGTLHVIVNNQVGFTTLPEDGRSTTYATDVAKMLQIPIFHVNGEDPEAVAQVVDLALDFRAKFQRDVVVDMYCYRRWGHNEGDEPGFTQPVMYQTIEQRDNVRYHYLEHLLLLGEITVDEAEQIVERRRQHLEREFEAAHSNDFMPKLGPLGGIWQGYNGGPEPDDDDPNTGAPESQLSHLLHRLNAVPADFHIHPKLKRMFERRVEMAGGTSPVDWAAAESLAFATLLASGHRVRITGQDCERGTFSHRHSVLNDHHDGRRYCPLANLAPDQGPFEVYNSPLSEAGVLGFEYGYSLDWPEGLIAWEAQFGDFWNAAQVIVDQFIASAEDKWRHLSGLVMLLPHGFEGQGPEHSSARVERFLQLAAEDNMQIVCPSTPSQMFHLLRRQVLRRWRKPLVVLTPKSLLRHPRVVSPLSELVSGRFQRVLPDQRPVASGASGSASGVNASSIDVRPSSVRRILMCTGRIYYDLLDQREKHQLHDIAIVRLEQLYPLPKVQLRTLLDAYPAGTPVYWVQDEPENMGAWRFLRIMLGDNLFQTFPFHGISRPASASPATGSHEAHKIEQQEIIARALTGQ